MSAWAACPLGLCFVCMCLTIMTLSQLRRVFRSALPYWPELCCATRLQCSGKILAYSYLHLLGSSNSLASAVLTAGGQSPDKEIQCLPPDSSLEGTLHRDSGHPHGCQDGWTNCLDSPLTCQDCPPGRTMESDLSFSRLPKAKTFALLTITFLAPLIPGVALWRGPPLTPTYYRWVLTESSTGQFIGSLIGCGTTLANLTLEYVPRQPITFPLDLCTLLGESLSVNNIDKTKKGGRTGVKGIGCGTTEAKKQLQTMGLYLCSGSTPDKKWNCDDLYEFFCPYWGCESISTITGYTKNRDTFISFTRDSPPSPCHTGSCNPLKITVLYPDGRWATRRTWGLRVYMSGWDKGNIFTIQRIPLPRTDHPVGPIAEVLRPPEIISKVQIAPSPSPVNPNLSSTPSTAISIPNLFTEAPPPQT
uniref:MLV-related proviral Env polyprotein-like n=1 Tax=Callithrix jacchus TaxID=9483 RepID=UPI0023DD3DB0|nr:MLV-related proviral Env polyprotein-like [Callithrix jacchus]